MYKIPSNAMLHNLQELKQMASNSSGVLTFCVHSHKVLHNCIITKVASEEQFTYFKVQ
jgi:hypothetical protein